MNKSLSDPPSLSTLSPSLLRQFTALSGGGQKLFKTLFFALWRYLVPVSRVEMITLAYLVPGIIAQANLKQSHFFMLCRLWLLTSSGSQAVNSRNYPFTGWNNEVISALIKLGYIVRTPFDPLHPHALRPRYHIQHTFISFTPSGVRFFRGVLDKITSEAMKDVFSYVDRSNKKGSGELST